MPTNENREPKEKPKETEPIGLQDARFEQIYEVLKPYRPPGDIRLYMPGAILNLEGVPREEIRRALSEKLIMTSDGTPRNKAARQDKPPCKRC